MTGNRNTLAGGGRRPPVQRARWPRARAARRIATLLLVYAVVAGGVVTRLVQVQVVQASEYANRGEQQRARTITLPARRGRLYDRQGDVLATSVDAATIYADPRAFRPRTAPDGTRIAPESTPQEVAATLSPLIGVDAATIASRLSKDTGFVYLARQLDYAIGEKVSDLDLPGIGVLTEPTRVYPTGRTAGQVVGFTGIDGEGLTGLELQYDNLLHGKPGQLALERAPGGLTIASGPRELQPSVPGKDLVLTLDREIQTAVEQAAAQAVVDSNARAASIVVLDPSTGDVLAMASAPDYDPNDVADADPDNFRNRVVTDVYEPGSVQKAITSAAALEEGVVTPDTPMVVDSHIRVGPKTFSDSHNHPPEHLTFTEVIEQSSNVGTIQVAEKLGAKRLADYLHAFGYGRPLGLGAPGESGGILMPVDQWWTTSLPTIAIGQGVAVTLLQMASFYGTIANGGVAVQPHILRGTVGEDGRLTPNAPGETRRVVSAETSAQLRQILATVVSGEHGTGKAAAVPGYAVAGKTGTARKPAQGARGYSGQYVASFVGFAPVDDPRLVVGVMVDEPHPIWGGVAAAPVFAKIMGFALRHERVPPTDPTVDLSTALQDAAAAKAVADATAAAEAEGPATAADEPGSPPVGAPAGGDGTPVTAPQDASGGNDGAGADPSG